jgi:hypothetical protein
MRIRIYTNDREQPIDLAVREIHTRRSEIRTDGTEGDQTRERSNIDQTVREIIKDAASGEMAPNILFTTDDGMEGAIYLNPEKIAAVVTSRPEDASWPKDSNEGSNQGESS